MTIFMLQKLQDSVWYNVKAYTTYEAAEAALKRYKATDLSVWYIVNSYEVEGV